MLILRKESDNLLQSLEGSLQNWRAQNAASEMLLLVACMCRLHQLILVWAKKTHVSASLVHSGRLPFPDPLSFPADPKCNVPLDFCLTGMWVIMSIREPLSF
jgi:hypothetical protein